MPSYYGDPAAPVVNRALKVGLCFIVEMDRNPSTDVCLDLDGAVIVA